MTFVHYFWDNTGKFKTQLCLKRAIPSHNSNKQEVLIKHHVPISDTWKVKVIGFWNNLTLLDMRGIKKNMIMWTWSDWWINGFLALLDYNIGASCKHLSTPFKPCLNTLKHTSLIFLAWQQSTLGFDLCYKQNNKTTFI